MKAPSLIAKTAFVLYQNSTKSLTLTVGLVRRKKWPLLFIARNDRPLSHGDGMPRENETFIPAGNPVKFKFDF